jgi:hypothetical protein
MSAAQSQPERSDAAIFLRLSSRLKGQLERHAAHYAVTQCRPVPLTGYLLVILEAHVSHVPCPCEPHCPGG